MRLHTIRLVSVVPHGVDGAEAELINFVYGYLLQEFNQDIYNHIQINQIGEDLDEFISKRPGNMIHINIRYPAYEDFEKRTVQEQNQIRLDVIHTALLRLAEYDKKLDKERLEGIRARIIENNFQFDVVHQVHANKKNKSLVGKVLIRTQFDRFIFIGLIEADGQERCRVAFFEGRPSAFYIDKYFYYGTWKNDNEFIISGNDKTVEIRIMVDQCKFELINLTPYDKPPYFELMRADLSADEIKKATEDYHHSLPPGLYDDFMRHLNKFS